MKKVARQSISITVFVFLMMWAVGEITDLKLFDAFDGMSQAFKEFELTDIVFSQLREDPLVDERIVVVNIGNLSRRDLAQQINIIRQFKPRVIGIDSYFNCEGNLRDSINCPQLLDTLGNLMLAYEIEQAGNVVLVSKLLQKEKTTDIDVYDSLEYSDEIFTQNARSGFANLITNPPAVHQDDVKQCRSFAPRYTVDNEDQYAFAVQICMAFDSAKTKKFLDRNKEEELINYRGNIEIQDIRLKSVRQLNTETTNYPLMFYSIDVDQLYRGEFLEDFFKDKIVIMGFLGSYFGEFTWSDKYFTPLNKKPAGRANPDMFGVVVHANIVAMILNEDYVSEVPAWVEIAIAVLTCYLTVLLFMTIDQRLPNWYDALSVTIQVVQLILISAIIVFAFAWFYVKLDLGLTLLATALVGPSYDIFKGFQLEITRRLTNRRKNVSMPE
ncbi:MAG: CHASE2 domain-containing protein [Cyclobacteriaceae bacterium]|nr:CHASE2 domain-containing protein [Cyclobacteriaceae bacterium]